MKQYVIDELRAADYEKIKSYLDAHVGFSSLEGLYRIYLTEKQLSQIQQTHLNCQPFYFALELDRHQLSCELLVRSAKIIRCSCIGYASKEQHNWLINWIDTMLNEIEIVV
jgi:hypothetical protein